MSWGPVQIFTPAIYWNLLPHCSFDVFPSLPPFLNQMKSFLRSLNHQRAGRGSAAVKLSAHWLSYIINFQIYLDVFLSNKFKNIKKLCKTASIFKLRDHYRSWEDTNLYRFSHHFKLYIAYSESIIENISLIF